MRIQFSLLEDEGFIDNFSFSGNWVSLLEEGLREVAPMDC